jgi:D-3-phosphoglycerate dehydrogenase
MSAMKTSFPKDRIRALVLEGVHADGLSMLSGEGMPVDARAKALAGPALAEAIADCRVLGIRSKTTVTGEVLDAAPKLMAIGCFCIGTNQVALDEAARRGIPVFNAPFSNTRSVAELTIAEIVGLHRRLADQSAAMHAGNWDKSAAGAHEIRGRTLGIVGYGHIGSQVSVLAEAMGMRVVFFDVASKLALGNARACATLGELLREADVVSLHVPETPGTRGLFGASEIGQMKRGSYLINNARGSVVDVAALAAALRSGHLGGAALDVFPDEPAGAGERFESELCGLKNVILTPHIGGSTAEAQAAISREVAAKLVSFMNTGSTAGAVNVPQVDLPEQSRVRVEGDGRREGARPHRILNFHRNEPGFLNKLNGAAAELGANIAAQYLQTQGGIGYVVLDVDPSDGESLATRIEALPGSIRTRVLW